MEVLLQIKMNEKLFVKNPEKSDLGKKIISQSIKYIHKNGFETLTFKKLAREIGTTEASIYRYFENKHKLLIYLTNWYWGWLEFQLNYHTNNINDPVTKLKIVIKLLATSVIDDAKTSYVDQSQLHKIVITEGSKTYLTKHVGEDNKDHLFEPYKEIGRAHV